MPAAADPDLALRLAKATADLYANAVETLLAQVARRLARGIDRPGWAEAKLLEQVQLRNQAQAVVDRLQRQGPAAVRDAITDAYRLGAVTAAAEVGVGFGVTSTAAVDALIRETVTGLVSTHGRILRSILDVYRTVIAEAGTPGALVGAETRRAGTQRALDRFADRGVTGFIDTGGRRWQLDTYAEMATRTAVGRAQVAGALDRYQAAGNDLVIVSDSPAECRWCRPWEGRVLSITGATLAGTEVGGFTVAGSVADAQAAGLQHPNCTHSLSAFEPGLTRPMVNTANPQGDAARQEQRRLEAGVRQWKRRAAVALDDQARREANARARAWQARLRQHVDTNDLKRQRHRETIGAAR
jgi:hypothetical protein